MNKHLAAMAAAGPVVFGAAAARAEVLAESQKMAGSGIHPVALDESVFFSFGVDKQTTWSPDPPPDSERRPVFTRLELDEGDVGHTIFIPASQFHDAHELLTNGTNNVVAWRLETSLVWLGGTFLEYPFLFSTGTPTNHTDVAGQDFAAIGLRVDKLELNDPAPGRYDLSLRLVAVSTPEPAAPVTLALGGLAALRRRRPTATPTPT